MMLGERHRPGAYRRAVRIEADEGVVRCAMEDDIHSFAVTLRHNEETIVEATAESHRTPWTTCAGASIALARLAGKPLVSPLPFADNAERYTNCTHMLDCANLAAGRAHQPGFRRLYHIEVESRALIAFHATLAIDGVPTLDWTLADGLITNGPYASLAPDVLPALVADKPLDEREPIIVLRRAKHIGQARNYDMDGITFANEVPRPIVSCHTLLPEVLPHAVRHKGTYVDFWADGRWPLED